MIGFLILVLTLVPLANFADPFAGDRALDGVAKGESVNDAIDHPKTIDDLISMDADPTKFRDIKDVVPNPPTQEGFDSLWYAIVLVVGLMIALVCWGLWYRFGRKPSFQHWALDQVDRLELRYEQNPDQAYGALSALVREYLRTAHGINASSETTEQLISSMQAAQLPVSTIARTEDLLRRTDLYRFGPATGHQTSPSEDMFGLTRLILTGQSGVSTTPRDGANHGSPQDGTGQ